LRGHLEAGEKGKRKEWREKERKGRDGRKNHNKFLVRALVIDAAFAEQDANW